jgi:thiamine biosynthesis lipoprotein
MNRQGDNLIAVDKSRLIRMIVLVAVGTLAGIAALVYVCMGIIRPPTARLEMYQWQLNPAATTSPTLIMGNSQFEVTIIAPADEAEGASEMLRAARAAARLAEAAMNVYDPTSPISQFNAAPADAATDLPDDALAVLRESHAVYRRSQGAFDVTIRPLLQLWKGRDRTDELPSAPAIAAARQASRWDDITLLDGGASKTVATAGVDLGGIAKGFGIDRATEALMQNGARGGLVNIGGDVRTFGLLPGGQPWRVGIRSPFDAEPTGHWMVVAVRDAAVCTSGNYERYSTIAGRRYSHILDPRTGWPAEASPSVSVIAPTASLADAWATALSVLGPAGLELLEGTGIEAMLVLGGPQDYHFARTNGFDAYVDTFPPGWPGQPQPRE